MELNSSTPPSTQPQEETTATHKTTRRNEKYTDKSRKHQTQSSRVLIVEDTDDECIDTPRNIDIQKVLNDLHKHCICVLNNVDLFDDDDLS